MILLILLFIGLIFGIVLYFKYIYRFSDDTVCFFTGPNGSGKTYFALTRSVSLYYKNCAIVRWHNFIEILKPKKYRDFWEKPRFFSNIPVKIGFFKKRFCEPLTIDMLLCKTRLPHRCVVYIDEVNLLVSQMNYKLTCEYELNKFVSLYRHFTHNGFLVVSTQHYNKCHWIFKYCCGHTHNLNNCFKIPKLFILTRVRKISTSDNIKQVETDSNGFSEKILFSFFFLTRFKYDTFCFDNVQDYQSLSVSDPRRLFLNYKLKDWDTLK